MYERAIIALGLTGLMSCAREQPAAPVGPATAPPRTAPDASPGLDPARREALEAEARQALRDELTPVVRDELRRELTPIVRAELERDLAAAPRPSAPDPGATDAGAPDPGATDAGAPDAATAPDDREPSAQDLWTRPGTRIWPSAGGIKLVDLRVGTALENKLPTDVRTHYPSTPEILYCYTVFENPLPDATITHVWRRGSRLVSKVELEVGRSPKWRTWSKQRTQPHWTGLWSCEVLGVDGQQLGLTVFQIGG